MTSEIAIMNRKAVALAADSVGTLVRGGTQTSTHKSFDTLHKLFQLPGTQSVGVMFYGNADCMGVPMETLIRMYPGSKKLPLLSDYTEDFLTYLAGFNFTSEQFDGYLQKTARRIFLRLRTKIDREVESIIEREGKVAKAQLSKIASNQIKSSIEVIKGLAKNSTVSPRKRTSLANKYSGSIHELADKIFENRPLPKAIRSEFAIWVINACCINPDSFTGLVFAGFGEDEHFPSCIELDIKGVFGQQAIYRLKDSSSIKIDNDVIIRPFAEADDVVTFMKGMNRDVQTFVQNSQEYLLRESLPEVLSAAISKNLKLKPNQTEKIKTIATTIGESAQQEFKRELMRYQSEEFTAPVFGATRHMTPDILAKMAETLIDLVSFRQEMSISSETVGGPIDVAVITKSDGFMWAKRKVGVTLA